MHIQIGNLAPSIDERMLARLFAPYGAVRETRVATHWETGRSTGVGCVEMESDAAGEAAIAALNGRLHRGRVLTVCWTLHGAEPPHPSERMFESMNIVEKTQPQSRVENRGLPVVERK